MPELNQYQAVYDLLKADYDAKPRQDISLSRFCLKLASEVRDYLFSLVDTEDGLKTMVAGLRLQNRCTVLGKHFEMGATR